jgi:hypothetical protein
MGWSGMAGFHPDYPLSGLKVRSVVRLARLASMNSSVVSAYLGQISPERLREIKNRPGALSRVEMAKVNNSSEWGLGRINPIDKTIDNLLFPTLHLATLILRSNLPKPGHLYAEIRGHYW